MRVFSLMNDIPSLEELFFYIGEAINVDSGNNQKFILGQKLGITLVVMEESTVDHT